MKMIKNISMILVSVLFTLTFTNATIAQPPDPGNCWASDPCTEDWNQSTHTFSSENDGIGLVGEVSYHWRICNGVVQIIIDWDNTKLVDPNFFANGSYEEIDFDGAREYLKSHVLQDVIDDANITIPDCVNGEKAFFNVYTARCGVWVKCSYKVDDQAEIMKDIGYEGDCPLPYDHNGDAYIDVWKWQSCGEICCIKSYELCKEPSPINGLIITRIKNVSTGPAPGESCTDEGTFKDWKTGIPYPCIDGCSGSGN